MESKVLNVEGMSCDHCVKSISSALSAINGVNDVKVDLAQKTVSVVFESSKTGLDKIKDAIADQGYEVK